MQNYWEIKLEGQLEPDCDLTKQVLEQKRIMEFRVGIRWLQSMESEWKDGSLFNKCLLEIYNCIGLLQFLSQELSFLYFIEYFLDIP